MADIYITVLLENVEDDADLQLAVAEVERVLQLNMLPFQEVNVTDWVLA